MKPAKALTHLLLSSVALGSAVGLSPSATANPPAPDICGMLAAGQTEMNIVYKLGAAYPNTGTNEIEQFVLGTERQQCPQYLNSGPSYPSGGDGLYPGSGPIVNGQGGWS